MQKNSSSSPGTKPSFELFESAFSYSSHQPFTLPGSRLAVLLIHGFPGTPAEMRPLAEALNQEGWHVQGLLLPGFGPEISSLDKVTHADWLNSIGENLTTLRKQFSKVAVAGFSMGGSLAAIWAARTLVDAAVLLAPYWRMNHPAWKLLPIMRRIMPAVKPFKLVKLDFSDREFRRGISTFLPEINLDDPDIQASIRNFTFPIAILDEIRKIGEIAARETYNLHVPALVIQGGQDELVTPAQTKELIKRIPHPLEYLEVEGKHDLPDPSQPAWLLISEKITGFLRTLQP